jgi:arsenate reductase
MDGVQLFKALSDEARLNIITLLIHGELNVTEMVQILDYQQTKISRHLSYLKKSNLVRDRKYHNQVLYSINTHDMVVKKYLIPLVQNISVDNSITEKLMQFLISRAKDQSPRCSTSKKILIICEHNSARSQMAQAFFNRLSSNCLEVHSAGLNPSGINQDVIKVMKEKGYDITHQRSSNIMDYMENNNHFDTVITVCDASLLAEYPSFPGEKRRIHWELADPSQYYTEDSSNLEKIRQIRNKIEKLVQEFVSVECE